MSFLMKFAVFFAISLTGVLLVESVYGLMAGMLLALILVVGYSSWYEDEY